jgi:hypothetical protein
LIDTLASLALLASAVGCVVFVLLYHVMTDGNWRRTPLGQNVMAFMAVCAALLTVAVARVFFDVLPDHLDVLRLCSYCLVAVVVWWRIFILIRAQRTGRNYGMYGETVDDNHAHTDERTPR